uniref:Putative tick transposon n=1 Tax=Ixodes ricinus TaxID=34613 RepID=A0A147BL84_IXORI
MNKSLRCFFFALQVALSSVPAGCCDSAASSLLASPGCCADSAQSSESSHPAIGSPSSYYHHVQAPNLDHRMDRSSVTTPTSAAETTRPPFQAFLFSGLGGSIMNKSLRCFFFALQVKLSPEPDSPRSDNIFLLLLPGPLGSFVCSSLFAWFRVCFNMLLRSGDVESNPGPDTQVLLKQLLDGQAQIAADVTLIKNSQATLQSQIVGIESRCVAIESELSRLSGLDKRVQSLEDKIARLDHRLAELADKNDDLENRSRRNNLIIYGLQEADNESSASLLQAVTDLLFSKLSISCDGIERCHRLGSRIDGKIRPVIFKVIDHREKILILKNAPRLKGTRMFINEDFSLRVRNIRSQLWRGTADFRQNGAKVVLRYDYALVNNTRYTWDVSNNCLVRVNPPRLPDNSN